MGRVPRARRVGSFAARLAVAVLLAACLTAAAETLIASRLADGAVEREAAARVTAAAAGIAASWLPARSAAGDPPDLASRLSPLAAQPDVLAVAAVEPGGRVLAALSGRGGHPEAARTSPDTGDGARGGSLDTAAAAVATDVAERGTPRVTRQSWGLTVTSPLPLAGRPAVLVMNLDSTAARRRAGELWRALGVVLALGAAAAVPLVFLTGGRRLLRRHERALVAAATDDLTGLGSRRAFRRDLAAEVRRAREHGLPLTLALIDLNGLDTVNATVGRRRGDTLIAAVATVLATVHPDPSEDPHGGPRGDPDGEHVAYRIGGDAFAVILPTMRQDDAFAVTDALRRRIALDVAPLTANIGLAELDSDRCPDAELVLIAADAALFQARSLGGNRVVGAGDTGSGLRWVATSGVPDHP